MKALDVFAAVISYFKSHKMDSEGRLRTKLYDKRDDLIFPL
jgi:hypothetical protein